MAIVPKSGLVKSKVRFRSLLKHLSKTRLIIIINYSSADVSSDSKYIILYFIIQSNKPLGDYIIGISRWRSSASDGAIFNA